MERGVIIGGLLISVSFLSAVMLHHFVGDDAPARAPAQVEAEVSLCPTQEAPALIERERLRKAQVSEQPLLAAAKKTC
jgi:hypothetical protein